MGGMLGGWHGMRGILRGWDGMGGLLEDGTVWVGC